MKPGKTSFPVGVDHFRAGRSFEVRADARDGLVFDVDVAVETRIRRDDVAVLDQKRHGAP